MTGRDDPLAAHPLTWVRQRRGWTMADVARIVARGSGVNMAAWRQKVYRWEHGVVPEPAAQRALAAALDVEQAMESVGWPAWLLLADPHEPIDVTWTPVHAREILSRVTRVAAMDRRSFLAFTGGTVAAVAATWAQSPPEPVAAGVVGARIGIETVKCLQARVAELWHLDDILGGGPCLSAAHADLQLVDTLLKRAQYNSAIGQELFSTAASLGRFAGWAAFDAGYGAAAQRYWHAALRAAHAADDVDQGVYILSNLALQAIYSGDGATAIDVLDTAYDKTDSAQRTVRAMLECWASRGHAVLGERATAAHRLNHADDLWESRVPGDDPDWVYWMPQPSTTAEAGTAMLHLGDHRRAEAMLIEGLADLDETSTRDANLYLVRIAEAQLATGRLDEATQTVERAIVAAAVVDSERVTKRVQALLDQIPSDAPSRTELYDRWRSVRRLLDP